MILANSNLVPEWANWDEFRRLEPQGPTMYGPLDDEMVDINEGCLSVPLRGSVLRHVNIRVRYLDRSGVEHDEVKRGLTAGTWQHECDHLDGVLFIDKVTDPSTLATWDEFEQFQRAAFVERITAFVARVGS